ncbi:MAG: lysostaphin resistance A-like protein [Terriglobales bacterium]
MNERVRAGGRFLLGIAVVLVANLVAAGFAPALDGSLRRFDIVYRPALAVALLGGFSFLLVVVDRVETNPLAAMGLGRSGPWRRDIWVGLLIGGGAVTIAVTTIAVAGTLAITIHLSQRTVLTLFPVLLILFTGALAEELMFRGYPFQRLVESVGAPAAVLAFSVLFAVLHLRNPHASAWAMLNTVLVGVLLSLAYLRTRALWMPWAIHFGWNTTLGTVFGLPVSGLNEFSVILRGRASGPAWLTGGSYGIEASVVGAVVILLGILVTWIGVRQRQPVAVKPESPESLPAHPIP